MEEILTRRTKLDERRVELEGIGRIESRGVEGRFFCVFWTGRSYRGAWKHFEETFSEHIWLETPSLLISLR